MAADFERWRNGCHGKRWYTTKAAARRSAHYCHSETDDAVHAYKCRDCGWWHIGSSRPREASSARKPPYKRANRSPREYMDADGY